MRILGEIELDFDNGKVYKTFKNGNRRVCSTDKSGFLTTVVRGVMHYNHRFLYQEYHGVKLDSSQEVYHLDRNTHNNKISNLAVRDSYTRTRVNKLVF